MSNERKAARKPIGVFDSGLGGFTVVREIRKQLPSESIIYFGDIARLPYGIKSKSQITRFSFDNANFLLKKHVKAIVVACNSSSSAALVQLRKKLSIPVIDVIYPAAKEAVASAKSNIGIIATSATVDSGAYKKALQKYKYKKKVYSRECPLLVPLVESGWLNKDVTSKVIEVYIKPLKNRRIDTLILGCTHYPLLRKKIQKYVGKSVKLIDSAKPATKELKDILKDKGLLNSSKRKGTLNIYVSDLPRNFKRMGERFLGEKINKIKVVYGE